MLRNFEKIRALAKSRRKRNSLVCVNPYDSTILEAIAIAEKTGIISPILVGDKDLIHKEIRKLNFENDSLLKSEIIDTKTEDSLAMERAIDIALEKNAILMKGLINTKLFLSSILRNPMLKSTVEFVSHVSILEIPGFNKLLLVTDGTVNVKPTLSQKISIVRNVIAFAHSLGLKVPKVAIIGINEKISTDNQDLIEAAVISKMADRNQLGDCKLEGPIPLDAALNKEAALKKKINSPVGGSADCIVCSNLESAANLIKGLVHLAKARTAGLLLGVGIPIVLTSRNDNADAKFNSICLAKVCDRRNK